MKIFNWWTDRYAIGGLFIASIVIGILYQLLLIVTYMLANSYHIIKQYAATIPEFRTPVFLAAEPDYHLSWAYFTGGITLLIVAKAFHKGYKLQQEQDLTV
ncbi:MAG: hypothetical protein ABI581_14325 [Sediminibacterium sp.]